MARLIYTVIVLLSGAVFVGSLGLSWWASAAGGLAWGAIAAKVLRE